MNIFRSFSRRKNTPTQIHATIVVRTAGFVSSGEVSWEPGELTALEVIGMIEVAKDALSRHVTHWPATEVKANLDELVRLAIMRYLKEPGNRSVVAQIIKENFTGQ